MNNESSKLIVKLQEELVQKNLRLMQAESKLSKLQRESEWVSVDDRLPEEEGALYNVYCQHVNGNLCHSLVFAGGRFGEEHGEDGDLLHKYVTHWKPITPPEGEG